MGILYDYLKELFLGYNFYPKLAVYTAALGAFVAMGVAALLLFYLLRNVFVRIIGHLIAHTKGQWDDVLFQHKVFHVLAHVVPAILIYSAAGFGVDDLSWLPAAIRGVAKIYLMLAVITAISRFLDASQDIYNTYSFAAERPIKGYLQLIKILIYFIGAILVVSVLVGQNPSKLFTGLGAMAAVLMLVFRDPILGLVASIQLAANKMIKPGDWITVQKFNVDGTVEDISLTTVKVQNWDKTITTIPTYSLVTEPVTNWIGMQESGGRRIQRSVFIDMSYVKFSDEAFMARISELPVIKTYHTMVQSQFPSFPDWKASLLPNPTNISLFRQYVEAYLRIHPKTHNDMTMIVRYLQSTERGLPLEYIVFSTEQDSARYEAIQADIVDHIIAILPEFDLRVFQNPSGADWRR